MLAAEVHLKRGGTKTHDSNITVNKTNDNSFKHCISPLHVFGIKEASVVDFDFFKSINHFVKFNTLWQLGDQFAV